MHRVKFVGRLFPSAVALSITNLPPICLDNPERSLQMRFLISVSGNDVSISCEINRWQDEDFVHVYKSAYDLVRAAVDLAGFVRGIGFTVILDKFVRPDGTESQLMLNDPSLAALCKTLSDPTKFDPALKIVMSDPAIFMALNDLMQSIILPHHAAVNCARAIEGLRRLVATTDINDTQAWSEFRRVLRLERSYIQPITDISVAPRHGDRKHIPGSSVTDATRRSWVIMDRFLSLKLLAAQELPKGEFPILS